MNLYISNNDSSLKAVKAVIYRDDGKILLQKRDGNPNIPFPYHWNLFGGEVEHSETLIESLERELLEEIEFKPKKIEEQIFQSSWKSYKLYFFPIYLNKETENIKFNLKEGLEYRWFGIDELIELDLVPAIYENLYKISNYLEGKIANFRGVYEKKLELKITEKLRIKKKNERVYYAAAEKFQINSQSMYFFLYLSQLRKVPVSRICLHNNDNSLLHEMYMFHSIPTSVGPLKQEKETISYHIIDGILEIETEDKTNIVLSSDFFQNTGASKSYRLKPSQYRVVKSKSDYCIFLEVNNGPFNDFDTIWKN